MWLALELVPVTQDKIGGMVGWAAACQGPDGSCGGQVWWRLPSGSSLEPCVWVCDYGKQPATGPDSFAYLVPLKVQMPFSRSRAPQEQASRCVGLVNVFVHDLREPGCIWLLSASIEKLLRNRMCLPLESYSEYV